YIIANCGYINFGKLFKKFEREKTMKKRISLIGLLLMMFIISACTLDSSTEKEKDNSDDANGETYGSGEYVIGVTYTTPESGATHIGMEIFKELIEEENSGDTVVAMTP